MYPSRNLGGAQLLFARLAGHLAQEGDVDVTVVDYRDGFIRRQLEGVGSVNLIDYHPGVILPDGAVTIIALTHLAYLRFMVSKTSLSGDFLLWSIHPKNIEHVLYSYFRHYFQLRKRKILSLLSEMAEWGTIVFMDGATRFSFEETIGTKLKDEDFLPIPIQVEVQRGFGSRLALVGNNISIAWLGRVSEDKVSAIEKIIKDISLSKYRNNITLHIIGDGPKIDKIHRYISKKNVKVNHVGVLEKYALEEFLMTQVHLGIAMGTSCLEFAKCKIPVAIADYSYFKIPHSHGYDWLYETENFTLGNDVAWAIPRRMSFDDLISDLVKSKSGDVGLRCYTYILENHSINSVSKKLIEVIDIKARKNRLKVSRVERLINPYLFVLVYKLLRSIKGKLKLLLVIKMRVNSNFKK
jgi:hypothetical protein